MGEAVEVHEVYRRCETCECHSEEEGYAEDLESQRCKYGRGLTHLREQADLVSSVIEPSHEWKDAPCYTGYHA